MTLEPVVVMLQKDGEVELRIIRGFLMNHNDHTLRLFMDDSDHPELSGDPVEPNYGITLEVRSLEGQGQLRDLVIYEHRLVFESQ